MCVFVCVRVCVAVWPCGRVAVWLWLRASQANAIWEANLMAGWVKPAPSAPQPTIEKWIRTKYQWKGFLGPQSDTVAVLSERLFASVEAGDVDSVYRYLAYGADVGWQAPEVPPPDDGAPPARPGGSALHRAAELGNVRVCVCVSVYVSVCDAPLTPPHRVSCGRVVTRRRWWWNCFVNTAPRSRRWTHGSAPRWIERFTPSSIRLWHCWKPSSSEASCSSCITLT